MSTTRVTEALARPVRTGGQMVPSGVITEVIDVFIYDLNEKQYAALFGLLVLLFGWLQVLIENWKGVAFLRKLDVPAEVPAVDSTPTPNPVDERPADEGGL